MPITDDEHVRTLYRLDHDIQTLKGTVMELSDLVKGGDGAHPIATRLALLEHKTTDLITAMGMASKGIRSMWSLLFTFLLVTASALITVLWKYVENVNPPH